MFGADSSQNIKFGLEVINSYHVEYDAGNSERTVTTYQQKYNELLSPSIANERGIYNWLNIENLLTITSKPIGTWVLTDSFTYSVVPTNSF